MTMRSSLLALSLALAIPGLAASPAAAEPGGCLKYGAAGALAGHAVHHGVKGFLVGCAAGMYRHHLYRKSLENGTAKPAVPDAGDDGMAPNPTH